MGIRGLVLIMLMALGACNPLALVPPAPADGPILVLEVDSEAVRTEALEGAAERMAEVLRTSSITFSGRGVAGDAARITPTNAADISPAHQALLALATAPDGEAVLTLSETEGRIEARLTESHLAGLLQHAAETSAQIISRRLSPAHPESIPIAVQGNGRFTVQAPSTIEPDLLTRIVTTPGQLTFHLVNDGYPEPGRTPPGYIVVQPHPINRGQVEIVRERPTLSAEHITRATPNTDPQTGDWVLSFELDAAGAQIFCRLTREHTGERFAILLDQRVLTAPTINEPICGGSGQISGNFTAESARELATLLNAGGLPAPIRVLEMRAPDAARERI